MKDLTSAMMRANALSIKKNKNFFVVYSKDEFDEPGNDYHIATDYDLDTFYSECDILYATEDNNHASI